jgi:hypothetical protein
MGVMKGTHASNQEREKHHFEQEKQEQHLSKKERKTLFDQKKG